jgi:hypothetical protein
LQKLPGKCCLAITDTGKTMVLEKNNVSSKYDNYESLVAKITNEVIKNLKK